MKSKTVAILETRTGVHLGELIERRGGIAMLAPALAEVPDVDPETIAALLDSWRTQPFRVVIFQTGVGCRALFQTTDSLGRTAELLRHLSGASVVVRGPKPTGELNSRGVRIDLRAASPFTTETVLEAISGVTLENAAVLVQRFGAANDVLRAALEARGASVREIATYRWALPQDVEPLRALLDALDGSRVDAVVFTSAVQIQNLYAVALAAGRAGTLADRLNACFVASIGPVCSRALAAHGVKPSFEANSAKLGPLVEGLDRALSA